MSLLDGLLRDALLQTVMQQDVYLAIRTDAPASGGAGTWDDPYYAGNPALSDSANAALFDGILSTKIQANQTVRLGPGTFQTKGSREWEPVSGTRIFRERDGRNNLATGQRYGRGGSLGC